MRLLQLIREKGMSQRQVALDLGIKPNTFNHYVTGRRQPPLDVLKQIAQYFNVSTDYLLETPPAKPEDTGLPVMMIPVYGMIRAGSPVLMVEDIEEWIPMPKSGKVDDWLALRVEGDSMNLLGIVPGCIAVFHKQETAEDGSVVAVAIDDEATIKTIYRDGDHIVLYPHSSNLDHHIQRYSLKTHSVRVLGVLDSIVIRLNRKR